MAILVLIFVVIFVARHRFNRGMGGGGSCARRWRHEKPNGGATVEKVNGTVHVSLSIVRLREIDP